MIRSLVGKYRFVGISLTSDGLKAYLEKSPLSFPIYSDLPGRIFSAYTFGGTPQTIVVSGEGKVLKNWKGAYTDALKQEVEAYFGVELPGVRERA
jgi:hypothetical protein